MKAEPKVKLSDARRFLRALDPGTSSFCFRTFDDDEERKAARAEAGKKDEFAGKFPGTLDRRGPELKSRNSQRAGVFVVINEGGHRKEDIQCVRAVFIDMDRIGMKPNLSGFPKPHIVVESSPGKRHYYWLVSGISTTEFTEVQKKLIAKFGSDKTVHDLPRVMRVPGFIHHKNAAAPFRTRIVKMAGDMSPYPAGGYWINLMASHNAGAGNLTRMGLLGGL